MIITDLELIAANRSDEVRKVAMLHFTKDGIVHLHVCGAAHRGIGTLLTVFDARRHGVAALAKADRLASAQACDPCLTPGQDGRDGWSGSLTFGYPLHLVPFSFHEEPPYECQ